MPEPASGKDGEKPDHPSVEMVKPPRVVEHEGIKGARGQISPITPMVKLVNLSKHRKRNENGEQGELTPAIVLAPVREQVPMRGLMSDTVEALKPETLSEATEAHEDGLVEGPSYKFKHSKE